MVHCEWAMDIAQGTIACVQWAQYKISLWTDTICSGIEENASGDPTTSTPATALPASRWPVPSAGRLGHLGWQMLGVVLHWSWPKPSPALRSWVVLLGCLQCIWHTSSDKNFFYCFSDMEMYKWLWICITDTNVMKNIKSGELWKPIMFAIPKPSRTPQPPPLGILLGIHVFMSGNLTNKSRLKDKTKSKNFIFDKVVSLRTFISR